jgi:hypothetical protein
LLTRVSSVGIGTEIETTDGYVVVSVAVLNVGDEETYAMLNPPNLGRARFSGEWTGAASAIVPKRRVDKAKLDNLILKGE